MLTETISEETISSQKEWPVCFHCGEDCPDRDLFLDDKYFCCRGCQTVYQILNKAGLCSYYDLNPHAGINQRKKTKDTRFAFLDSPGVYNQLVSFKEGNQVHTTLYIPAIHCSSCIYLLENFHNLAEGVVRCDIDFLKKEVSLIFNENTITLREVAERLAGIGYEPYISHSHSVKKRKNRTDRSLVYRLGVAGFCFGNIMLFSIPEYFSGSAATEPWLQGIFRYLNVAFSIPVFFYSAAPFFISSWKGIKQKYLNIDVPVALAILATYVRSLTDVFVHDGSGFFDAMAGIVFFMLAGRVLQNRTQKYLFFDRDYADYFPMAAMVIQPDDSIKPELLSNIKEGDRLRIHNSELVPADSLLIRGKCLIDYSFVTGESIPVEKRPGDLLYAGGKQLSGEMEIQVVKETPASRLVQLWSKDLQTEHDGKLNNKNSFVHKLARNFTLIVLAIATMAGIYWWQHDASLVWPVITAILIIACPCGLLLTSTFTNGHVMRILSKNGFFLRHPFIIERIGKINHIVFDKTGTLTSSESIKANYKEHIPDEDEKSRIASAIRPSLHAFKNPVLKLLNTHDFREAHSFREYPGLGISAFVDNHHYKIGAGAFFDLPNDQTAEGTPIYVQKDGHQATVFLLNQGLRPGAFNMFKRLKGRIGFTLLSGDEPHNKELFGSVFGNQMHFKLTPAEKLSHIESIQTSGNFTAMAGDGLNDAGALQKSDVGICITDDINRFTPAGDAILQGDKLSILDRLIHFCHQSKRTIQLCFGISVLYNITGLFFAVQGLLSPLMAAILMPLSTLTIIVTTFISSTWKARSLNKQ